MRLRVKINKKSKLYRAFLVITVFLFINWLLFSLGTTLLRLHFYNIGLKLLKLAATTDLGLCNLAEYQLATYYFSYTKKYSEAKRYYQRLVKTPFSCFKYRIYYNLGIIYTKEGASYLKSTPYKALDQWALASSAFEASFKKGGGAKAVTAYNFVNHNIYILRRYMFRHCINVCHPNCPPGSCPKELKSSKNKSKPKKPVETTKLKKLEATQKKAYAKKLKRASQSKWYKQTQQGQSKRGW